MASIKKLTDKPRNLPVRAIVKMGGYHKRKMFKTEAQARLWANQLENNILTTGLPQTIDNLKKITVGEIIERYLKEVTPTKASKVNEAAVLNKFLRERKDLCRKALAYVSKTDAYDYRNQRLKDTWRGEPITTRTIAYSRGHSQNAD